jgi:hypothetical protein
MQQVSTYGIIAAGRKEVDAVSAIAVGHIVGDEVVIGVGEVYSIPAFSHYAVKAGIVSGDDIPVGKEESNAGLSAVDYSVVGDIAARHTVELYSVKTVPDGKAADTHIVRIYVDASVSISGPDNRTIAHQIQALLYGYLVVDTPGHLQGISWRSSINRSLQI